MHLRVEIAPEGRIVLRVALVANGTLGALG
jgi:hypothetical protein